MRLAQIFFSGLVCSLLLVSCSSGPAVPASTATPAASNQTTPITATTEAAPDAYPGPAAYPAPANPYPIGQEPTSEISNEPLVVSQPSSDQVGSVTGTVYRLGDNAARTPVGGTNVYLGTIVASAAGVQGLVQVDKTTAPRGQLNGLGQFVIADVPPGRYGLMLETPQGTILLNNPDTGDDMLVEITGGQLLDLGELAYSLPDF